MILNYIKRLMGWRTEMKSCENIAFQIQKQILKKRRYAEGKPNKSYGSPPEFRRSVVRYVNLANKDTKNVIFLKKRNG
tara:strand:- start:44 stop:277 length:234 start_codon:yes stop_codon:yes gene_type:complete